MRFIFFVSLLFSQLAYGQFNYIMDAQVPVVDQVGNSITMPWAGGLNSVQFNTMDLNNDGIEDIVLFDRMAGAIRTFIRMGEALQYVPEYETMFPEISFWMLLRDYNGDGRKDVFTGDNLGIRVYENTTIGAQPFTWKHIRFYSGFPEPKSDVLLTKGVSIKINLQLNYDDLPSIADADGDGDLDIFSPGYASSTIEYHKNLSVEKYNHKDSLDFERVTQTWGGVTDCGCGNFVFDGMPCPVNGRLAHAGGKSLLALDVDNDGDQDLLFSESTCTTLYLLRNDGASSNPQVTTASQFPFNSNGNSMPYPAAYFEDADGDGISDLIISSNSYLRESLVSDFQQSVWFYKNIGTTEAPQFAQPNTRFLQGQMIDVGDNAAPVFFDVDADGDFDLFIGSYATGPRGTISYYENIGSATQPSFKLVTEDFLDLSGFNFVNVRPTFADMNGDGTLDLVFSATFALSFQTALYYISNSSLKGGNFSGQPESLNFFVFPFEPITLVDVDVDGKIDLLIGRQNGSLEFWKNTGTTGNPFWTLVDDSFLGVGINFSNQYPAATSIDLNNDRKPDLIVGHLAGGVNIIDDYRGVIGTASKEPLVVYNSILNSFSPIRVGGRAWTAAANLFRTDKPSILIGSLLGGLYLLKPATEDLLPSGPLIEVFPNPVFSEDSNAIVTVRTDRPATLSIFSALGQEVMPTQYLLSYQEYKIPLIQVNKGVYIFKFTVNGKIYVRRVVRQ
jgi:hypothetical protein